MPANEPTVFAYRYDKGDLVSFTVKDNNHNNTFTIDARI
jgi:hypothetical protein